MADGSPSSEIRELQKTREEAGSSTERGTRELSGKWHRSSNLIWAGICLLVCFLCLCLLFAPGP